MIAQRHCMMRLGVLQLLTLEELTFLHIGYIVVKLPAIQVDPFSYFEMLRDCAFLQLFLFPDTAETVTASSVYVNNPSVYGPAKVFDNYVPPSEHHHFISQLAPKQWLQVEFYFIKRVTGVTITTRTDCCGFRFIDTGVYVGNFAAIVDVATPNPICRLIPGPFADGSVTTHHCNTPLVGKYLVIQSYYHTENHLELAELVVHGETLSSVGGTATSSSIYLNDPAKYHAKFAIDGLVIQDANAVFKHFHTQWETLPWFQLELDYPMEVSKVTIILRVDYGDYRTLHYVVHVGNQPAVIGQSSTNPRCGWFQGPAASNGLTLEFPCAAPLTGKYVIVQMKDPGLQLLEFNEIIVEAIRKCKFCCQFSLCPGIIIVIFFSWMCRVSFWMANEAGKVLQAVSRCRWAGSSI